MVETNDDKQSKVTARLDDNLRADIFDTNSNRALSYAKFWSISMTMVDSGIEMIINLDGDLVIGRGGESTADYTYLDLSSYNALELGISRKHVLLSLKSYQVVIRDLNATNHTYINEQMLEVDIDYPLNPKDVIQLGKFKLQFNLIFDPFSSW